ncbi:MAG: HAMP domain-containing protein [Deltaproteobacteria bacterium]|nr:MAG: HAMP domain-containing protein [Deltaproteobacteria bacterium]
MMLVAVAPLAVISLQAWELTGTQVANARKAALERECVALADEIGRWVQLKAQAVSGWTRLYPGLADRPDPVKIGLMRSVYRAVPGVVTVALLDDKGPILGQDGPLPPVWLDAPLSADAPLSSRSLGSSRRAETFLKHLARPEAPGEVRLGLPYRPPPARPGAPDPDPAVVLAARSPFDDALTLAVDLALDDLDILLAERTFDGRGWALFTRQGEQVLSHGPAVDGQLLRPLLEQRQGSLSLEGQARRGALAAVPGVPWTVVLTEPDLPDPAWVSLRLRLALALLAAILVAVIGGFLASRTLSRPIATLRDATRQLAEGDLSQRVDLAPGDEIGDLGRAFNEMAQRLSETLEELQARREEVEATNRALEIRVDERTRDLQAAQAELVRAGQLAAIAEVGAGLAHDLNNPLTSVIGSLQLLRHRVREPAIEPLIRQAEREAQRCREVAGAMLRLSEHREVTSEADTPLDHALDEVIGLVRPALRRRGVELVWSGEPTQVRVGVSIEDLRHALTQILQAVGAGLPSGSRLSMEVSVDEERAMVVLEPGQPVGAGLTRDAFLAAGLGLWGARRLLAARGGRLVSPNAPEEAGLWRVELPRA